MNEKPSDEMTHKDELASESVAENTVPRSMVANSLLLGGFALLTAVLLSTTYTQTAERIAMAERDNARRALLEIIPAERHDNALLDTTRAIAPEYWSALGLKQGGDMHIATLQGEPLAVIIPAVAPDGYSGDIRLIVGVNSDGTVAGVRVLAHAETPGLGDKVELKKDDWILSFNGRALTTSNAATWAVKKDGGEFDQFTGATITPRAVVNQVRRVLQVFNDSQPLAKAPQIVEVSSDES